MKKLLAFAIVILGFSAVSFGQVAAVATATATTEIKAGLTIEPAATGSAVLNFGTIYSSTNGGDVIVAASSSTDATLGSGADGVLLAGTAQAAQFKITAPANQAITIALPENNTVQVTSGTGGAPMKVKDFTKTSTVVADATGLASFYVGATLEVAGGQTAGTYTSTEFNVTVSYN